MTSVFTRQMASLEFVGMPNSFGESGQPDELLEKYHMKARDIVEAVMKAVKRKIDLTV